MKIIPAIFLILFSFLLQSSIFEYFRIDGIIPNLVLIALVLIIMAGDQREVFAVALAGGLLLDFSSPFLFGIFTLSFIMIGFALAKAKLNLFAKENFIVLLVAVFLATTFNYLFAAGAIVAVNFLRMPVAEFSIKDVLFIALPMEILYNLVFVALIFGFWKITQKLFSKITHSNGFRPNFR